MIYWNALPFWERAMRDYATRCLSNALWRYQSTLESAIWNWNGPGETKRSRKNIERYLKKIQGLYLLIGSGWGFAFQLATLSSFSCLFTFIMFKNYVGLALWFQETIIFSPEGPRLLVSFPGLFLWRIRRRARSPRGTQLHPAKSRVSKRWQVGRCR